MKNNTCTVIWREEHWTELSTWDNKYREKNLSFIMLWSNNVVTIIISKESLLYLPLKLQGCYINNGHNVYWDASNICFEISIYIDTMFKLYTASNALIIILVSMIVIWSVDCHWDTQSVRRQSPSLLELYPPCHDALHSSVLYRQKGQEPCCNTWSS